MQTVLSGHPVRQEEARTVQQCRCSALAHDCHRREPCQRRILHCARRSWILRGSTRRQWDQPAWSSRTAAASHRSTGSSADSTATCGEPAVLLVDHGSRRTESNEMLETFAELYRKQTGRRAVRIAHMELASPSIQEAVAQLAEEGYHDIVVAPYFLSNGRHITEDIPALMAEAQAANPQTHCRLADPIGVDPIMAAVIEQRVLAVLGTATAGQQESQPVPAVAVVNEKE